MSKIKSIEQLIKEIPKDRIRTIKWYEEKGYTWKWVEENEFNLILQDDDGKLWNIELPGHDWEEVDRVTKTQWNEYRKPILEIS